MKGVALTPLASAAAVGLADEYVAKWTKAAIAVKGSYLPRFGFEAAVIAGGTIAASRGFNKNIATSAAVAAASIFGRDLAYVFNGTIKL